MTTTELKARKPRSTEPGISRIDQEVRRTFGWYVRNTIPGDKIISKFFPDRAYGGKPEALVAARAYRAKMQAVIQQPLDAGDLFLSRMEYARVRGWMVRLRDAKGKVFTRLFSDSKYTSSELAHAAATVWRDVMVVHLNLESRLTTAETEA